MSMSPTVSTKLQQIAELAAQRPDWVFRSLAHQIDEAFLREAYVRTRKDAAPGIDGVTAAEYAKDLEANLSDLHGRLRSGSYRATPVRRVWIPKDDGAQRPIGVKAFEDKIAERAVAMLLGAIYEQDFLDCSYGFREGRSQHQALKALRTQAIRENVRWVVDADVKGYFDSIDHAELRKILSKRVKDGSIIRLIGKWLNAGVMDGKELSYPTEGTPQGGVISPLLANIFLHEVLDVWFEQQVKPRLRGRSFLVRFADDFVIGCEVESDARRILAVLPKRFAKYGLTIHPEKTVLVPFGKPTPTWGHKNGTFDFLGFTHYWGKSRQGHGVLKRKTAKKRLRRAMKHIWTWCKANRHRPFEEQYRSICNKLRGHIQYYGIRGNVEALKAYVQRARRAWRFWLDRRTHKNGMLWERFEALGHCYPLPKPRIVHPI
jgi:group II intron reverse transcriptase/maturase